MFSIWIVEQSPVKHPTTTLSYACLLKYQILVVLPDLACVRMPARPHFYQNIYFRGLVFGAVVTVSQSW